MIIGITVLLICALALWHKNWVAVIVMFAIIAGLNSIIGSFWGAPCPPWATSRYQGATLIDIDPDEPHAFYVWVVPVGETEPFMVKCPWDAEAVQQAMSALENSQNGPPKMRSCKAAHGTGRAQQATNGSVGPNAGDGFYTGKIATNIRMKGIDG